MDLSIPDFIQRLYPKQSKAPTAFAREWTNAFDKPPDLTLGSLGEELRRADAEIEADAGALNDDGDNESSSSSSDRVGGPDGEGEEEEVALRAAAVTADAVGMLDAGAPAVPPATAIQVLDLHSDNPLISYRGRLFSARWAENLGTELLLMGRDQHAVADGGGEDSKGKSTAAAAATRRRRLPILRELAGGVDLVAASSARLVCTERQAVARSAEDDEGPDTAEEEEGEEGEGGVEPEGRRPVEAGVQKEQERQLRPGTRANDKWREVREEHGVRIPVQSNAGHRRKAQVRFLENLQAIKMSKGEEDEVTIIAMRGPGDEAANDGEDDEDDEVEEVADERPGAAEDVPQTRPIRRRRRKQRRWRI